MSEPAIGLPNDRAAHSAAELGFLDFQIDKTYHALSKAGERLGASFVYCLLFLALAAALSLGDLEAGNQVTLPLLGFAVSRWHAAGLSLVLASVFFYSLALMQATERILALKLIDLVSKRFGQEGYLWYTYFPSPLTYSEQLGYISVLGGAAGFAPIIVFTGVTLLIPYLAYELTTELHSSVLALIMAGTSILLLLLSLSVWAAMPHVTADRRQVLSRLGE